MNALDAAGEPHATTEGQRCRNCATSAPGRFCPECGQATALHPPSVREFVHEFITHNVAFEGALWRTMHALVVRPGLLTTEYFAGRRARYIPPLRLYLTFSLILFAFSTTSGDDMRVGGIFRIGAQHDAAPTLDLRPGKVDETGFAPLDRMLQNVARMTPAQRTARVASSIKQFLPYVLICLVPLLAVLLKVLYWKRRRLYGEHLVVAFHAQTAAFVFGCVIAALPDFAGSDALSGALLLVVVAQGVIAMRRVYGGRLPLTIVRTLLVFAVYGLAATFAVAGLTVASLAT